MASLDERIALLERMLLDAEAVARLPDAGRSLKECVASLQQERKKSMSTTTIDESADSPIGDRQHTLSKPLPTPDAPRNDANGPSPEERLREQEAVGELTQHYQPDLAKVLEERFRGILSRREVARLVREAGPNPLVSWAATRDMIATERELERTRELERLRRITAPPA